MILPSPPCKGCISLPICLAELKKHDPVDLIMEMTFLNDICKRCDLLHDYMDELTKHDRISAYHVAMICKHFRTLANPELNEDKL